MPRTTAQHITKQIRALPKRLWSLTHLTILLTILVVALCAGASALVIQHVSNKPVQKLSSNITSTANGSTICVLGQPNCQPPSNTLTPSQSTTPQSTDSTKPSTSAQSQSNCVRNEIPYRTTYQDVTYLKKGQTQESGGYNGFMSYCGSEEPFVAKPVDKIVYVGTAPTDEEIEQQRIAAQVELEAKQMQWNRDYASAYQSCLSSLPNNYPSKESFCAGQASQQVGPYPR